MAKVHEFNPIIYPFKLWIMVTDKVSDIEEHFEDELGRGIEQSIFSSKIAITLWCVHKETNTLGVIIVFRSKKDMCVRTIAHESFHAADFFADELGLDCERKQSNEHIAYLVGWAAKCCDKVKKGKV